MNGFNFLTNDKGKKTAVQIPIREWESIQKELRKLELLEDLKQAFHEMKQHEAGKLNTPTTEELLAEL